MNRSAATFARRRCWLPCGGEPLPSRQEQLGARKQVHFSAEQLLSRADAGLSLARSSCDPWRTVGGGACTSMDDVRWDAADPS